MHISDIIKPEEPTFSFEFFPPKSPEASHALYETIKDLSEYKPSFVSVTYGAGGTTRDLTHDLVLKIKETTDTPPVPHLTCVSHSEEEITSTLDRYASANIGNILGPPGRPSGKQQQLRPLTRCLSASCGPCAAYQVLSTNRATTLTLAVLALASRHFPRGTLTRPTACWKWTI